MSIRPFLTLLAAGAMAAIAGVASAPQAQAMPVVAPIAAAPADNASGAAVAPGSGLIENVYWRGGRGWRGHGWRHPGWRHPGWRHPGWRGHRRGFCWHHPRMC